MWIRRDIIEVEKEREKNYRSIKRPLLCGIVSFFSSALIVKLGYNQWEVSSSINPITWREFFFFLPFGFIFSLLFFLIIYYWQIYTKKQFMAGTPYFICTECYKLKEFDNSLLCDCLGELVKTDEMTWVKD